MWAIQQVLASYGAAAAVAPIRDMYSVSYTSKSFSVSSQEANPIWFTMSDDWEKVYICWTTNDTIYQYTLSTPYDISTASYDSKSFSVSSQASLPTALYMKAGWTKMYMVDLSTDDIFQYTLSTAYDISTASYDSISYSFSTEDANPRWLYFKPDWTEIYIWWDSWNAIERYTLSTAWDVSTASHTTTVSISSEDTAPRWLFFSPDGDKMFLSWNATDKIYQYTLSTPWDISTLSYDSINRAILSETGNPWEIHMANNYIYLLGENNDTIFQYEMRSWISAYPTTNLEMLLTLDGSGGLTDSSGNGRDAVATNISYSTPSWANQQTPDFIGNGNGEKIDIVNNFWTIINGSNDFAFCACFKSDDSANTMEIFQFRWERNMELRLWTWPSIDWKIWTGSSEKKPSYNISTGTRYSVICNFSATTGMDLIVNEVSRATDANTAIATSANDSGIGSFITAEHLTLDGRVANCALFSKELSASEITQIQDYNEYYLNFTA